MNRRVEGTTLAILRQIASLRYVVSIFRFPSSLLGTRPGVFGMHALDVNTNLPTTHLARIDEGEPGDLDFRVRVAGRDGGDGFGGWLRH